MRTTREIITAGVAAIALAAPAVAGAQHIDLRSPDARDAAQKSLRPHGIDLRTPDARDAADRITSRPLAPPPVRIEQPSSANGFSWGDAGIGAAGMLGVVGVVTGVGLLTVRRRRDGVTLPTH
jgi:hypothetical protein